MPTLDDLADLGRAGQFKSILKCLNDIFRVLLTFTKQGHGEL